MRVSSYRADHKFFLTESLCQGRIRRKSTVTVWNAERGKIASVEGQRIPGKQEEYMSRAMKCTRFLIVLALATGNLGYGQTIVSSIVGQVSDASGAVVPSAQVTVTNEGTRISVQAITDAGGTYSIPNLYAGVYTVEAKCQGFEGVQFTGIQVLAGQSVRQDFVLKAGSVLQQITVRGAAPLVHTDSINVAGELTTRQLDSLPVALQSIDTLLALVPGAQTAGSVSNPESGGGQYWGGTNFAVNGIAANDVNNGRGAVAFGTGMVALPALSSMQEFKVDVSNMSAEYRMQVGVNMVTKQGTNKFHGAAYEYNQNAKLEANLLTLNAAGIAKPAYNRNQFGGNVGGPIYKNKAFFFFNFSGFRQRQYTTVQLDLPTAAMRTGNFGALCASYGVNGVCTAVAPLPATQLYNPLTGAAFSGNVIPTGMITSQSQTMDAYLPNLTVANATGIPNSAPNYVGLVSAARDFDDYEARVDWQVTAKDTLTGFATHNVGFPWFQPQGSPPTYGGGANFGYKTIIYQLAEAHTFGTNTINDLRVGWFNFPQIRTGQNANIDPTSLFPQQPESAQRGLPKMTIQGYSTPAYGTIGDYGQGLYSYAPDVEILENFTHVRGRHTLKAGVDLSSYQYMNYFPIAPLPSFIFSGVWTGNSGNPGAPAGKSIGNAFADYLLGDAISSGSGFPGHDSKFYAKDWELYFQDTWQASSKLTVYYGIRYMNQMPWTMRDNLRSSYNRTLNKLVLPENSATPTLPPFGANANVFNYFLPYLTTTKAVGLPLNYMKDDGNNWGPRIGFAFRPFANGKTVFRGGYGVYYAFIPVPMGASLDSYNIPWSGAAASYVQTAVFATGLPARPTSQYLPDITFSNPFPSAVGGASAVPAHPALTIDQRNLVLPVEQEWNLTLERQLGVNNMVRASYVGSQTHHSDWYYEDINVPTTQTPNATLQNQRILQPWANMYTVNSGGKQNFDQLQLEYIRHFASGLSAQVEYQWTQALTNNAYPVGGPQIPAEPDLDYTNNSETVRHRLIFNYVYDLPIGRGKHWLTNAPKVVDGALGGWQVAGITTYQTGFPMTVNFQVPSKAPYSGSWWGGRADRVASNLYAKQSGHNVISGVQWINPAAFAPPQPWQWGNSPPYVAFGPGLSNWDMSAQKNFRIPVRGLEAPRLQFRADFLDAPNHFALTNGVATPATIGDTRDGGAAVPSAGKIFSGTGNRIVQVGLRLDF